MELITAEWILDAIKIVAQMLKKCYNSKEYIGG